MSIFVLSSFQPRYTCGSPPPSQTGNRAHNSRLSIHAVISISHTYLLEQTHRQPRPRIDNQRRTRDIRRSRTTQKMNSIGYLVKLRHALQRHDGLHHVLEVRVESCFVRVHGAGHPGRTDGVDADAVGGVVDCCSGVSFLPSRNLLENYV